MIKIKDNIKNYGKEKTLWYNGHQGEVYPVVLETRKGFLVNRPNKDGKMFLVKHKHAEEIIDDSPSDDDMV